MPPLLDQFPVELQEAWLSQLLIGLDKSMMQAKLSHLFGQCMDASYLDELTKNSTNGQVWTANLANTYLQGYLMAWQARNNDRHGHDITTRQSAASRQAVQEKQQL